MNETHEDSVLNFDLNFLRQTSTNTTTQSKQIAQVKKRIIRADALIKSYKFQKQTLEKTTKSLATSNQECIQTSIDLRNAIDRCTLLDKELQELSEKCKTYKEERDVAKYRYEALQSHTTQLEVLTKEQEKKIAFLENNKKDAEKLLAKLNKSKCEKLSQADKKSESYEKQISELIEVKNELEAKYKKLLWKHKKIVNNDLLSLDEHSESDVGNNNDFDDDTSRGCLIPLCSDTSQTHSDMNQSCPITNSDNLRTELDNYCINDIDGGRGSSLASSDNEKSLQSPEYCFCPIQTENTVHKCNRNLINTSTSPIPMRKKMIEVATSPISMHYETREHSRNHCEAVITIDRSVSPIIFAITKSIATSPIRNIMKEKATSPIQSIVKPPDIYVQEIIPTENKSNEMIPSTGKTIDNIHHARKTSEQQKCLELNSSNNIADDCHTNNEIELILDIMRLKAKPISPMPITPPKPQIQSPNRQIEDIVHHVWQHALEGKRFITDREEAVSKREKGVALREQGVAEREQGVIKRELRLLEKEQVLIERELKAITRDHIVRAKEQVATARDHTARESEKLTSTKKRKAKPKEQLSTKREYTVISEAEVISTREPTAQEKEQVKNTMEHIERVEEQIISVSEQATTHKDESPIAKEQKATAIATDVFLPKMLLTIDKSVVPMDVVALEQCENYDLITPDKIISISKEIPGKQLSSDDAYSNPQLTECLINEDLNIPQSIPEKSADTKIKIISDQMFTPEDIKNLKNKQNQALLKTEEGQEMNEDTKQTETENTGHTDNTIQGDIHSSNKDSKNGKVKKSKKLTSLEKYRKKCELRKFKIKKETPQLKQHLKPKMVQVVKKVLDGDSSATLNKKEAYDNAVKIMAEYNAKSINNKEKGSSKSDTEFQKTISIVEKNDSTSRECEMNLFGESPVISPVPDNADQQLLSPLKPEPETPESTIPVNVIGLTVTTSPSIYTSPKQSVMTPKVSLESPRGTYTSARYSSTTSPELSILSTKPLMTYSRCSIKIPVVSLVKSDNVPPKQSITSVKPSITSPMPGLSPLRPSMTSSSASGTTASHISSSAKPLITSPLHFNTSPVMNLPSPKPRRLVSPKSSFDTQPAELGNITSPKSSVIYKDVVNLPDQSSVALSKVSSQTELQYTQIIIQDEDKTSLSSRKRKLSTDSGTKSKKTMCSIIEETHISNETNKKGITSKVISKNENQLKYHPKDSILCGMIEKYGVNVVKHSYRIVPDAVIKPICDKIESEISKMNELTTDRQLAINKFISDIQKYDYKNFVAGLIKYLTKADRKLELFMQISSPPAPPMTKSEEVLLIAMQQLQAYWSSVNIVELILNEISYVLFQPGRTPEFDVIESISHFYGLLCRYFRKKRLLRMFMLDAMYFLQFKSIPLIKQCLEAWPYVIPVAHTRLGKSPLVTCFVYLLHFFKCEDKYNRVQDMRNILQRKYLYKIIDWNEPKILDMFRSAIREIRDIPVEKKMLRFSLILLAKRHGPRWAQTNIIKNMLQPFIEKENTPEVIKEFCISLIGPLMKPYPVDMKSNCEVAINQLVDILKTSKSTRIDEAVISSVVILSRHNQQRVNEMLVMRKMQTLSPQVEKIIRDYVRTKSLKLWKGTLSKMPGPNAELITIV